MTLSPKMMTVKASGWEELSRRLRMLREGLLRALESRAQMPMVPMRAGLGPLVGVVVVPVLLREAGGEVEVHGLRASRPHLPEV